MKCRMFSIITALALVLSLCPVGALAAEGEGPYVPPGDDWGTPLELKDEMLDLTPDTEKSCYKAGEGMIYCDISEDGTTYKLILVNAKCEYIQHTGHGDKNISLELYGDNVMNQWLDCAKDITLTGDGSLTTAIIDAAAFNCDNFKGQLNALVLVHDPVPPEAGDGYMGSGNSYVYGRATIPSGMTVIIDDTHPMTLKANATLTVDADGTLEIVFSNARKSIITREENASIVNNGTVTVKNPTGDVPAYIKSLGLTGSGVVKVVESVGGILTDKGTYTNSGAPVITKDLDFSDPDKLSANDPNGGYQWDQANKTLTLKDVAISGTVTLPDDHIRIVTEGSCSVKEFVIGEATPKKTQLTFYGPGTLTIEDELNISGGDNNALTIEAGATVTADGGVRVNASGGTNGCITVNGTLNAKGVSVEAVYCGKVVIGSTGTLKVEGKKGVMINVSATDAASYTGAFTIKPGGTFSAICTEYNLAVNGNGSDEFSDEAMKAVFDCGGDWLPSGYVVTRDQKKHTVTIATEGNENKVEWDWTDSSKPKLTNAASGSLMLQNKNTTPPVTPDKPSGGGSGGGSDDRDVYRVTVEPSKHGEVKSNRTHASSGTRVTLTVGPDRGCLLDTLTVTDSRGKEIALTVRDEETYTFQMPDRDVTVQAAFAPLPEETGCSGGVDCPSRNFTDVGPVGTWYHEAVDYVLRAGLMNGYSNEIFGTNDYLTRAQFAQILHNKEGRPAVNYLMQFEDVSGHGWYTEAVRWAASQSIVVGYGNGQFGPHDNITREQLAVILWRYAGSPAASQELPFADADQTSDYALEALCWAVDIGIITGKSNHTLSPDGCATRAEAAVMLMRYGQHSNG